jgi:hypothetical protein
MVLAASFMLTGCTTHRTKQIGQTDVKLDKSDYVMIKPAAMGYSRGFKLLGLIPFWSPSYAKAKMNLYDSVGQDLAGRSIALANYTSSQSTIYLIAFSIPKITISADIVEFKGETPKEARGNFPLVETAE